MKPSPELVEAARQAFYNNQGGAGDDPFELALATLAERGLITFIEPKPSSEIPGELELFQGRLCPVVDPSRIGWWRFHEHYDRDGYCDNPARGY